MTMSYVLPRITLGDKCCKCKTFIQLMHLVTSYFISAPAGGDAVRFIRPHGKSISCYSH